MEKPIAHDYLKVYNKETLGNYVHELEKYVKHLESTSKEEGNNNQGNAEEFLKSVKLNSDYVRSIKLLPEIGDKDYTIIELLDLYSSSHNVISESVFIELENYVPIDIDYAEKEYNRIFNIPNDSWKKIKQSLEVINTEEYPNTLRHFELNMLPYSVIKILSKLQSKELPLPESKEEEYTLEDVLRAAEYGFNYTFNSQLHQPYMPTGNTLQWLMHRKKMLDTPKEWKVMKVNYKPVPHREETPKTD